jgi:hypothetical protein
MVSVVLLIPVEMLLSSATGGSEATKSLVCARAADYSRSGIGDDVLFQMVERITRVQDAGIGDMRVDLSIVNATLQHFRAGQIL